MFINESRPQTEEELIDYLEQEVSEFSELWDEIILVWRASYALSEFYMELRKNFRLKFLLSKDMR